MGVWDAQQETEARNENLMPFEIIYNTPISRIITMGRADKPIEQPVVVPVVPVHAEVTEDLTLRLVDPETAEVPIPDEKPLAKPKPNRGRPKKMAKDKLDHESGGPETIREDDAGEQGAIGTHGENAPAQDKVPEKSAGEGKDNG